MKKTARLGGRNLIGPKLRKLRLAKTPEITLEDLSGRLAARGVHLDRSAIGRIENAKRYVLDYELKAIADALRISLGDLF
ncbi:MAG TPA: helix-turn-helix transcriptional regulator [Rariglobus sp.]|nr:helix-turn-helix transcriptional regulator [Rariglobus sp.]